jgi:PAS domain S-box-containing protein
VSHDPITDYHHLAAIVESAEIAIISKRMDGIIRSWNPGAERLFGYGSDEIVGQHIVRLLPEGQEDEEERILKRLASGERIEHYESIRRRKDGSIFPVSLTISPVKDGAGIVVGASKIVRDISDLKQLEAQATLIAQLQKALAENKILSGLLPMCAWCNKIRDDQDYWQSIEEYFERRTQTRFTHGICPECAAKELRPLHHHEDPGGSARRRG